MVSEPGARPPESGIPKIPVGNFREFREFNFHLKVVTRKLASLKLICLIFRI